MHRTFKAAILEKLNAPLVVDWLNLPELGVGQVLVEVHCSGICGKQMGEISGWYGEDKFLPHLLGHEGGGVVVEIGVGVKNVKVGDHVVMHWRKGIGIESDFPKYRRKDCERSDGGWVGGGLVTTFSQYSVVSENRLTPISKEVPFEVAALMGCALTTGFGIVNNEAHLKMGQSIAVFGCGSVGLNVILGAKMMSGYPIVAIDKNESKLRMAIRCGATNIVNIYQSKIREKFDVFVECTGIPENIATAFNMTKSNGKTILVGQTKIGDDLFIGNMNRNYDGKKMFASQGGKTNPTEDIPRYVGLYLAGKLKLDSFGRSAQTFSLSDINLALDVMRSGEASKIFIRMDM